MSITGIDNTDLGATQTPGLTSVRTPIIEIGQAAAEQLIARLEGKAYEAFQSFPIDVVYRGSTAPPIHASLTERSPPSSALLNCD